jgi:hypothetical protein
MFCSVAKKLTVSDSSLLPPLRTPVEESARHSRIIYTQRRHGSFIHNSKAMTAGRAAWAVIAQISLQIPPHFWQTIVQIQHIDCHFERTSRHVFNPKTDSGSSSFMDCCGGVADGTAGARAVVQPAGQQCPHFAAGENAVQEIRHQG